MGDGGETQELKRALFLIHLIAGDAVMSAVGDIQKSAVRPQVELGEIDRSVKPLGRVVIV